MGDAHGSCRGRWSLVPLVLTWVFALVILGRPVVAQEVHEVFRDCDVCPQMILVLDGRYGMGSPETEDGHDEDEGPRHVVAIDSFAVGVYQVTFEEWAACAYGGGCAGLLPEDEGWGRANRPVVNVSWEDARAYVEWLSQTTGEQY